MSQRQSVVEYAIGIAAEIRPVWTRRRTRNFVAAACLCIAGAATAEVIVVGDQTQEAIQAALDQLGGPGTVIVPPGRYQVDGTVVIRNDGVTLQGSGDASVLFRSVDDSTNPMVESTRHAQVRITGLRFEGFSNVDPNLGELSNGREVGVHIADGADFRVDHCSFTRTGRSGVWTSGTISGGTSSGVVDHCAFEDLFNPVVNNLGYGVEVGGVNVLQAPTEPFGSGLATFIEDSSFRLCRHAVASNRAARYVFRNNYVALNQIAHAVDAHGHESGSVVGTEWADVHDNLIENPIYRGYAVRIRGGMGLVWNNSFSDYNQGIELTQDTDQPTGPIYIWDNSIVPETSPMLRARGTMGTPVFFLSPPADYVPFPYPHPLAAGAGAGAG